MASRGLLWRPLGPPTGFDGSRDRHTGRPHSQFVYEMVAEGLMRNLDPRQIQLAYNPRLALTVTQIERVVAKLERDATTVQGRHGVGNHARKIPRRLRRQRLRRHPLPMAVQRTQRPRRCARYIERTQFPSSTLQ